MFCRSEFNIFYRILWLQASCYIILYFCEKRFLLWTIYIHLLYFQGRGLTNLDVLFSCRHLISSLLDFIHYLLYWLFISSFQLSAVAILSVFSGIETCREGFFSFTFFIITFLIFTFFIFTSSSLISTSSLSLSSSFCSAPASYFFKRCMYSCIH